VAVTAGGAPISGWTVTWTFPDGQAVSQSWGAVITSTGAAVTATNAAWNGGLAAGAGATFGFIGTAGATNGVPVLTCTAS